MKQSTFTIEIFEGEGDDRTSRPANEKPDFAKEGICAWMYRGDGEKSYRQGQQFTFPDDMGKMCPWVVDSINMVVRVMAFGGNLPWKYAGTPYEKEVGNNGRTTEYIRCIDPTHSGIVLKITKEEIDNEIGND